MDAILEHLPWSQISANTLVVMFFAVLLRKQIAQFNEDVIIPGLRKLMGLPPKK